MSVKEMNNCEQIRPVNKERQDAFVFPEVRDLRKSMAESLEIAPAKGNGNIVLIVVNRRSFSTFVY